MPATELAATEARYRRIVENTNQGVWVIDAEGKTTLPQRADGAAARTARRTRRDRANPGRLPPRRRAAPSFADRPSSITAVGASYQHEARFAACRTAPSVWALIETSPITDAAGPAHAASFAMVMDVTARKQAEASLRVSEERFRSLWESGIILITISDLHGRIVDVNEGFASRAGLHARGAALRGRPVVGSHPARAGPTPIASPSGSSRSDRRRAAVGEGAGREGRHAASRSSRVP
jgi:two-component system sensor histidine kinase/response regulator